MGGMFWCLFHFVLSESLALRFYFYRPPLCVIAFPYPVQVTWDELGYGLGPGCYLWGYRVGRTHRRGIISGMEGRIGCIIYRSVHNSKHGEKKKDTLSDTRLCLNQNLKEKKKAIPFFCAHCQNSLDTKKGLGLVSDGASGIYTWILHYFGAQAG
ncbi:hypothetical protein F5Y11DRAFT_82172 [Daldinia sp. FL1419]|nr:hypothetical protein F5Y11DRAFT_82172 [Daldinia sp. FL1419]